MGMSLDDVREWAAATKGIGRPCHGCGHSDTIYKRPLTSAMTHALVSMHDYFASCTEEWVHLPTLLHNQNCSSTQAGGDPTKMRFWGLIEQKVETREDGSSRNGYWKITEIGRQFVRGEIAVRKYLFVYRNAVLWPPDPFQHPHVMVRKALGTKFNYDELMGT